MTKAFITGLAGPTLSIEERLFLRDHHPAGVILFSRNCVSPDQIRALVANVHAAVGTDRLLVLVDQEGGRVQRLRPPIASLLPPAAAYAAFEPASLIAACHAARQVARLAAGELTSLGINTDCAPVLDVPVAGAHDIIGNRAFGRDPETVIALGAAFAEGLIEGGVVPVMKHLPGHGRAFADSHLELPIVHTPRDELLATDVRPFKALSHLPAAMTAHVVFASLDPSAPASTSAIVTRDIVRGFAGFDGLLMSDDLGMRALTGTFADRTRAVLDAGSDLALHCSGSLIEMHEVASVAPDLAGRALDRYQRALAVATASPRPFDRAAARDVLDRLVATVA